MMRIIIIIIITIITTTTGCSSLLWAIHDECCVPHDKSRRRVGRLFCSLRTRTDASRMASAALALRSLVRSRRPCARGILADRRHHSTHSMTQHDDSDEVQQFRQSVQSICADFPGEYWRELDKVEAYPTDFVKAMTDSGFLGILIPEEYGGSGLGLKEATVVLEEIHRAGCNAGAAHAQMYIMGSILHSGNEGTTGALLA